MTKVNLALAYGSSGRTANAVNLHEQVVGAFKKKYGSTHPDTQIVIRNLAAAYLKDNRLDVAATTYRDLLAATRPTLPPDSPDLARTLAGLGDVLLAAKKFAEAESVLRECLTIRENTTPADWRTFFTKSTLGAALAGQKRFADAEPLLVAGFEGMKRQEKKIQNSNERLTEALDRLIHLAEAVNKPNDVKKWQAEKAKVTQNGANRAMKK